MASVYVSSTVVDLAAYRVRVREALQRRGHKDLSMELYGAQDERPLDKCLKDVAACDLYVGIFAWRYGFVPAGHQQSITELEFAEAVRLGKHRLLFLLDENAAWPGNLIERAKLTEVDALRKWVSEDRVVETFANEDQLYAKVTDALIRWEESQGLKPQAAQIDWELYRDAIRREHQWVRLNVIAGPRHERITQIPLLDVFVPQLAEPKLPSYDISAEVLEARRRFFKTLDVSEGAAIADDADTADERPEKAAADIDASPAVESAGSTSTGLPESVFRIVGRERTQVIVGGPGTGKTTLLLYIMLRTVSGDSVDVAETSLARPEQGLALPFLIELRQYLISGATTFVDYMAANCTTRYAVRIDAAAVRSALDEPRRSLVFFDGLDEVFDSGDRVRITEQFKAFATTYPNAQLIVTTRIAGYQPAELELANFTHYTLQDFNIQQTSDFLDRWYTFYTWEGDDRSAVGLIRRIVENPRLKELAGNPLLLTMMAILYKHQDLPERRWELYERATSVLLDDWDVKRKSIKREAVLPLPPDVRMGKDQKAKLLQRVSNFMLERGQTGKELNAIAYSQLIDVLAEFLRDDYKQTPGAARDLAGEILNYVRERTFILAEIGDHIYGFVHRTFMEYFAASHIRAEFNKSRADYSWLTNGIFSVHWQKDEWREVLLLLIAMLADQGSPIREVVEHLNGLNASPPLNKAFAACCLAESPSIENQDLAHALFVDLAEAIAENVTSRSKQSVAFVEDAQQAFSILARGFRVPAEVSDIVKQLVKLDSFPARMAAWQLGFAMKSGHERLRYALTALQHETEAVRRGAIRVLEREWPGNEEVRKSLIGVIRDDRYARVRQAALDAIQRGWPKDEEVLAALRAKLGDELAATYVVRVAEYLASTWKGSDIALRLVLDFAGSKLKELEYGISPEITQPMSAAVVKGWRECPTAFRTLCESTLSLRPQLRRIALAALSGGWAHEPDTLPLVLRRTVGDPSPEVRAEGVGALRSAFAHDPSTLSTICGRATTDEAGTVRLSAVVALGNRWPTDEQAIAAAQDRAINDDNAKVCRVAWHNLARAWPVERVTALMATVLNDEASTSRRRRVLDAIDSLPFLEESSLVSLLEDRVKSDGDPVVRMHAMALLVPRSGGRVDLVMDRMRQDADPVARVAAMCVLIQRPAAHFSTDELIRDRIEQDTETFVRCTAIACWAGDVVRVWSLLRNFQRYYHSSRSDGFPGFSFFSGVFLQVALGIAIPADDNLNWTVRQLRRAFDAFHASTDVVDLEDENSGRLSLLLDKAVSDADHVVRAVSLIYALFLAPKHPAVVACLSARQREETHDELRSCVAALAAFADDVAKLPEPPDVAAT